MPLGSMKLAGVTLTVRGPSIAGVETGEVGGAAGAAAAAGAAGVAGVVVVVVVVVCAQAGVATRANAQSVMGYSFLFIRDY
jgi:hypothetical protein